VFSKSEFIVEYCAQLFQTVHLKKIFFIQIYFKFFRSFRLRLVVRITFDFFIEPNFVLLRPC